MRVCVNTFALKRADLKHLTRTRLVQLTYTQTHAQTRLQYATKHC